VSDPQLDFGFDGAAGPAAPAAKPRSRKAKSTKPAAVGAVDPEALARELERHPDYRVLRRLVPQRRFDTVPQGPLTRVVLLDTETTGLDSGKDKIIELAMLRVAVDTASGLPCGEVTVYDDLEDPGVPISRQIEVITGINGEMVRGKRLDEARIAALLEGVDLVIAHNAAFDRPFVEARLPQFKSLAWACSFADIDWKQEGQGSAKLEYLAMANGWFYDAHRAEVDCHALLAVLNAVLPTRGLTGLNQLVQAAQRAAYRLQATAAPFDAKDMLKSRGYRWNAEAKCWQTMLADEAQLQAECDWLKQAVYGSRAARVQIETLDSRVKYSGRAGDVSQRQI
jgi:DNA polymerase-3 subunit epsilon